MSLGCLWAEPSDYSSSSEDDEYSDPLEVAAFAGTRLSTPHTVIHSCMSEKLYIFNKHIIKVCFVRIQSRSYRNRKPDFHDLG